MSNLIIFATSSSGLGALGVSGSAFVIQLITFILGYLVLRKYAFGPIIKALNERRKLIDEGVKLGDQMREKNQKLEEQIKHDLAQARIKADQIISDAEINAKELVLKAENEAQSKANSIIEEAARKTEQDMKRAKRQLESEIVTLITEVSEALAQDKIDSKKDLDLINRSLREQEKV